MFELKPLSKEAIPKALEKAERYRLLNEPVEAESICRDVLRIDPENQQALITLLLALTDQVEHGIADVVGQAREALSRLRGEYERAYYAGIICERRAKAQMLQGGPGSGYAAHAAFREAMDWYEKADSLRPPGNDDARLRWNTCVRILGRHPELRPVPEERWEPPLE
jgi:tetratricopeptide (TPR) repeat protein